MTGGLYGSVQLTLAAAFAVVALVLAAVRPIGEGSRSAGVSLPGLGALPDLCPERRAGGACPGCGLTRGIATALRGDLESSRRFHAGAPGFALLLLLQPGLRVLLALAARARRPNGLFVAADFAFHAAACAALLRLGASA